MFKIFVSPPAADVNEKKKILIVSDRFKKSRCVVLNRIEAKRRILESDTGKRFIFVEISFAEFF